MAAQGKSAKKPIRLRPAGFEYCVRQRTAILELGFSTEGQAHVWANDAGLAEGTYSVLRRPVGLWEVVSSPAKNVPRHVDMDTND